MSLDLNAIHADYEAWQTAHQSFDTDRWHLTGDRLAGWVPDLLAALAAAEQDRDKLSAELAKAAGEFRRARQATRRLTAVLTANASRLDVPFTNADSSPWELHVKPAMYALREALGIRAWQPEAAEHSAATPNDSAAP